MSTGTLYLLPCPIDERTDVWDVLPAANRAVMASLDYFIVENTRTARRFLARAALGKGVDTLAFVELSEHTDTGRELEAIMQPLLAGRSAGVISEAGLPGVADPGAAAVAWCHRNGVRVVPLVGPSSLMLALMASGLNGQSFAFNGYLPVKPHQRAKAIRFFERRARSEGQAQLFIETPYRNDKLLTQLIEVCAGETLLTVAADLTGPTEQVLTRPVAVWRAAPRPALGKRPAIFILG